MDQFRKIYVRDNNHWLIPIASEIATLMPLELGVISTRISLCKFDLKLLSLNHFSKTFVLENVCFEGLLKDLNFKDMFFQLESDYMLLIICIIHGTYFYWSYTHNIYNFVVKFFYKISVTCVSSCHLPSNTYMKKGTSYVHWSFN